MLLPKIKESGGVFVEGQSISRMKRFVPGDIESHDNVSYKMNRGTGTKPDEKPNPSNQEFIQRSLTEKLKEKSEEVEVGNSSGSGTQKIPNNLAKSQEVSNPRSLIDNTHFLIDFEDSAKVKYKGRKETRLQKTVSLSKDYQPRIPYGSTTSTKGGTSSQNHSVGKNSIPFNEKPTNHSEIEMQLGAREYIKSYLSGLKNPKIAEISKKNGKQRGLQIQKPEAKDIPTSDPKTKPKEKQGFISNKGLLQVFSSNKSPSNHTPSPKLIEVKALHNLVLNQKRQDQIQKKMEAISLMNEDSQLKMSLHPSYPLPGHSYKSTDNQAPINRSNELVSHNSNNLKLEIGEKGNGYFPVKKNKNAANLLEDINQKAQENNLGGFNFEYLNKYQTTRETPLLKLVRDNNLPLINQNGKIGVIIEDRAEELRVINLERRRNSLNRPGTWDNKKQNSHKKFDILYNLFCGISAKKEENHKPKYGVGNGNNEALIQYLFRIRGLYFENFFTKCSIIWTQIMNKRTSLVNIKQGIEYINLNDPNTPAEFRCLKIKNSEALENQIIDAKMFIVQDRKLVKEITQKLKQNQQLVIIRLDSFTIFNHISGLGYISTKKNLHETLKSYCEFNKLDLNSLIPETWIIRGDFFEKDLELVIKNKSSSSDQWKSPLIVKPGENSNRGQGIAMAYDSTELCSACKNLMENRKSSCSLVIQNYITDPLLFKNRKFDFRCYGLVHRVPGRLSYFWYSKGYARTCSFDYDLEAKDNLMVHLTNEAVQVKGSSF